MNHIILEGITIKDYTCLSRPDRTACLSRQSGEWRASRSSLALWFLLSFFCFSGVANAAEVLIINGSTTTSEPSTTGAITTNLEAVLVAKGDTVTISDPVPADLSPFDEVWDIRFSNSGALTAGEATQFSAFLQAGKELFLMGENDSFTSRNDSLFDFIASLGGGTLTSSSVDSLQDVAAFLRSPNNISTVTYNVPGGVGSAGVTGGSGEFLSSDSTNGGTAVGFPTGSLSGATSGSVVLVFDVNFMQDSGDNGLAFLENISVYVSSGGATPGRGGAESIPAVPVHMLALLALALCAMAFYSRAPTRARNRA